MIYDVRWQWNNHADNVNKNQSWLPVTAFKGIGVEADNAHNAAAKVFANQSFVRGDYKERVIIELTPRIHKIQYFEYQPPQPEGKVVQIEQPRN